MSQYMANRFRELGVPFAMTRTTDETLTPAERVSRIKNAFGTSSDVILVSNHINSGGGEGAETIYALRNTPDLARGILTEIGNAGQKTRSYYQRALPDDPTKDYYYIMRDTSPIQAVIIEYGFLDNSADALRLKENWEIYTEAAVKAIMQYINKPYTPPTSGKIVHIVVSGDTLFSIANRFNTTVDEIKRLNNLTSNNLSIGQQLLIPGTGVEIPPPSGNIVYIVKTGDTLFNIANRFNVTVEEIKQLNNLTSNLLSVGQQLLIPGVSITPPEVTFFTYIVKTGDTLFSIANRFNTTVDELKQINNLTSNLLSVGQQLLIPNVVTEPEEETFVYIVVSGDNLFSIANRFNTTVDELKRINNLTSNLLSVGQQLLIPTKFTYTVVSGDSLFSIAKRFNTTVDELKRVNNLTSNSLSIGQQLIIPR